MHLLPSEPTWACWSLNQVWSSTLMHWYLEAVESKWPTKIWSEIGLMYNYASAQCTYTLLVTVCSFTLRMNRSRFVSTAEKHSLLLHGKSAIIIEIHLLVKGNGRWNSVRLVDSKKHPWFIKKLRTTLVNNASAVESISSSVEIRKADLDTCNCKCMVDFSPLHRMKQAVVPLLSFVRAWELLL